jgi:hypothetical protein
MLLTPHMAYQKVSTMSIPSGDLMNGAVRRRASDDGGDRDGQGEGLCVRWFGFGAGQGMVSGVGSGRRALKGPGIPPPSQGPLFRSHVFAVLFIKSHSVFSRIFFHFHKNIFPLPHKNITMVSTRATSQAPATLGTATQASAHDYDDNESDFTDIGEIERQLVEAVGESSDAPPSGQPQPQPQPETESPTPTVSQQLAELMQAVQGMTAPPVTTPQPTGNTALLSALVQAVTALASNSDLTAAATRVGAPIAPTAGEDPRILPIRTRFPAVDPTLLVEILENRFKVENLLKLNASFIYTPERKHENIYLGGLEIPTARSTVTLEEYHNLSWLMEPFEIYCQVLVEFTAEQNKIALAAALGDYRRRLYELNRRCSWDSIRHFHFSFHRKRVLTGISDPAGWRKDEPALAQLLQARQSNQAPRGTKRPPPYDSEGASHPRRNGPQQPDVVIPDACRRYNRNVCNAGNNCPWRHVCYVCGAANHVAPSCPSAGKPAGTFRGTPHGGRSLATGGNSA